MTSGLRLTSGVRYTDDYKFRYGHAIQHNLLSDPITLAPLGGDYVNDATIKGRKVTWRLGFDADLGRGLLYGSVATGYKQGGFGDGCSTGFTTKVSSRGERCDAALGDPQAVYYNPESVTAYELGYRGRIAPGVRVDIAGFYYDYKDMQLNSVLVLNGAPTLVTTNAGRSTIKGVEFSTVLNPTSHQQVTIGVNWLDAKSKTFCPGGFVGGVCQFDMAGKPLDRSPKITVKANYQLTIPVRKWLWLSSSQRRANVCARAALPAIKSLGLADPVIASAGTKQDKLE